MRNALKFIHAKRWQTAFGLTLAVAILLAGWCTWLNLDHGRSATLRSDPWHRYLPVAHDANYKHRLPDTIKPARDTPSVIYYGSPDSKPPAVRTDRNTRRGYSHDRG